ncbi:polyphosphate polymerase domain-containing protein [Clostridium sp. Sa3CUN1]|uniref:Polyphosphate polymerase domain-containing protein n=1 Tax=Clostridium gallinarum TaxID=2762246 RepID=A0ABR8Q5N6_9CLOT|nr:polyphosphate polymerase domain-containing protein [Clostridium gallinarum]MBD7915733.1 polyphosphate polymerase domain-containing protein [Clostridium gallinarum]
MNEVLRKEKKFLITLDEYYRIKNKLEKILKLDSNSNGDGYIVRSLYFDTIDDTDYENKDQGLEMRRKIRLRNYGANSDFAVLEIKQKQGEFQKKRSLKLSKEDAFQMINGNYSVLLKYNESFAYECYCLMNMYCYKPKAVIEYKRKAFVVKENKIRITFDHNIRATESNFNIFDESLNQNLMMNTFFVVLEVKYNGFLLSYIKDLLNECSKSELSVSKYCLGRTISKHYLF